MNTLTPERRREIIRAMDAYEAATRWVDLATPNEWDARMKTYFELGAARCGCCKRPLITDDMIGVYCARCAEELDAETLSRKGTKP